MDQINALNNRIFKPQDNQSMTSPAHSSGKNQGQFSNILKETIADVNESQIISDQKTETMARGEIDDLHDVMISAQKASISLETTVQVQKKVIDAYNEIMRMQV